MKTRLIFISAVVGFIGYAANAQQLPQSNLYDMNKFNINPAYAGYNGCFELYGSHLSQWAGFDKAPTTDYISGHAGLGKNMGLGAGIVYDKASYVSTFNANVAFAYKINLGDDHNLRLGLSAKLLQSGVDATGATVDDVTDEVIFGAQGGLGFDGDFGLFYSLKNLKVGISVPNILQGRTQLDFPTLEGFQFERHMVFYGAYKFDLNDTWKVEPSVMVKDYKLVKTQLDINAMVTYNNLVSIGLGFRTEVGMLARVGLNIKDKFVVGYAYEFASSAMSSFSSGSHEVLLGMKICRDKPEVKPSLESTPILAVEPEEAPEEPEPVVEVVEPEPIIEEPEVIEPEVVIPDVVAPKYHDVSIWFSIRDDNVEHKFDKELDHVVKALQDNPTWKVSVTGHSCDIGPSKAKVAIAKGRAEHVKDYLKTKGISSNRIISKGVSDSQPLVPNTTEENKKQNRRADVKLIR
jgi:type IX secretion system PorP/SprF family membrane protein